MFFKLQNAVQIKNIMVTVVANELLEMYNKCSTAKENLIDMNNLKTR